MQSDTGKKTGVKHAEMVQDALALMQTIRIRFKISDEAVLQSLAVFASGVRQRCKR